MIYRTALRSPRYYALEEVLNLIEQQPKIGEWVQADSPPLNDDKVLVSYLGARPVKMLVGFDKYKRYPKHNIERWEGKGRRVKAWQPLPEPWEGKE